MSMSQVSSQNTPGGSKPDEVELHTVQDGAVPEPSFPLEEDIMQASRIGAIEIVQKLVESKNYGANYKDNEGITPLHWAAINNQYAICKYLLEHGADVNAQGGESHATAAMWAAQRCHFYIVNLMIQHGVDLTIADAQGYNILHLATIDGNALLVILLLLNSVPVDVPDPQGHTALMWAGYKGWPAIVDLLLRWSANVTAADNNGFTPLHWALVKGSKPCLEKLVEYGADRFAKTNDGKTPSDIAAEMNSRGPYARALHDQGYNTDGQLRVLPLGLSKLTRNRSYISKFFFLFPFFCLFVCFNIVAQTPSVYIGFPLSILVGLALQYIAQWVGQQGPSEYHVIHKTPFLAGIFAGSLFWLGLDYVYNILPLTLYSHPLTNVMFLAAYASTTYFYFLSMLEDPGYIPLLSSRNQQREAVAELFSLWKFDEENFCVQCLIRRPLRSKHCRRCGRCVAKHDHHCPWINGCVANNNLRHFYMYILSMEVGIFLFLRLVIAYLDNLYNSTPRPNTPPTCNILPSYACQLAALDSFTIVLTIWSLLQSVWVTMLLIVQSLQIAKNITTYENMKRHNHSHHGTRSQLPLHSSSNIPPTTDLNDTAASATRLQPAHRRSDSFLTRWKKMLGIDVFLTTASDASEGQLKLDRGNAFSRGPIGNCKDFWCDPAPIFGRRRTGAGYLDGQIVDYNRMYERPNLLRSRHGMRYERIAEEEEQI